MMTGRLKCWYTSDLHDFICFAWEHSIHVQFTSEVNSYHLLRMSPSDVMLASNRFSNFDFLLVWDGSGVCAGDEAAVDSSGPVSWTDDAREPDVCLRLRDIVFLEKGGGRSQLRKVLHETWHNLSLNRPSREYPEQEVNTPNWSLRYA
jgi:hypothetical protein